MCTIHLVVEFHVNCSCVVRCCVCIRIHLSIVNMSGPNGSWMHWINGTKRAHQEFCKWYQCDRVTERMQTSQSHKHIIHLQRWEKTTATTTKFQRFEPIMFVIMHEMLLFAFFCVHFCVQMNARRLTANWLQMNHKHEVRTNYNTYTHRVFMHCVCKIRVNERH